MRRGWMLVLPVLLALPFAAWSDSSPQVTMAVAGGAGPNSPAIERFTLRFSESMVPLGDPRAAPAATSDCPVPATGRWVDEQTFVLDFERALPGGVTCNVKLTEGLKTRRGAAVLGTSSFPIDTGGPSVRAVLAPGQDQENVDEDQVFVIATNVPANPASVARLASCTVDGIGEAAAVDVLPADTAGKLLDGLGENDYHRYSFLSDAGLPTQLPKDAAQRAQALANIMALRCRRPLPPERDMALLWPARITDAHGKAAGRDQRFDFTVRKAFTASWECGRINAGSACNPITPAHLRFSAPVSRDVALKVRLRMADGSEIAPQLDDDSKNDAQVADLVFKGPFPAASEATLVLPEEVVDISGRKLANAERFPLAVKFDESPPLVKFAASFGILEAKEGGVLPVTVRAVEPDLIGNSNAVPGRSARVADDDAAIAEWLRKLDSAEDGDYEEIEQKDGTSKTVNHTREKPIMAGGTALKVGLPGKGKDFEVVGIPLKNYGFHVVEFASPALGKALLGRNVPRYVAAGALVTDMAVHFKWGRESSLAWVTALETGKPVAGADVRVSDSCTGALLASGKTDASGLLRIAKALPDAPETGGGCDEDYTHPVMVSARSGADMSFTLSSWTKGIAPYDFELPFGSSEQTDTFHTVFDRTLLKTGETVHFKTILRHPTGAGFAFAKGITGKIVFSHQGSDTSFSQDLTIGAGGSAQGEWAVPQGAPLGDYSLSYTVGEDTIYSSQTIRVDEYRLPNMRATVAGPDEAMVRPSSVPLSLFVGYLSGGGAGDLPVTLRSDFESWVPAPRGWERFTFGGNEVKEGTRPLDDSGEQPAPELPYAQTLPATLGADGTAKAALEVNQPITRPVSMMVEMDYPDANGETLTAGRRLTLYPSSLQVGLRTDGWLMRDNDLRLEFVVLDLQGKPAAGKPVSLALYSREIITARRRLIGGFYAYDNQEKVAKLAAGCTTRTDSLGRARCALSPGVSGEVTMVATTTDGYGRQSQATSSVWLVGEDEWWFGGDNGDRMDVIPESLEYAAGDIAKLQVRMPFREATALVTVEREGVLSSFVTELSGKDPVISVKLPGSYAPNVYVSVMAVRGRVGGWRLWLADLVRSWGLDFLSPEGGSPTALVDLSKPSYRIGMTSLKVGWQEHKLDVAVKADKERYAVRDVAQVSLQVKEPGGKPAASADVAFVALDEALLQLQPNHSWELLEAMMGERNLEVVTSTAQMQVVGKRHYGKKAVAAGGGGGDASGVNRENFQPLLLWQGHVPLDAQGRARVAVPLSDALSRFRLVAIATSGAQLFGTGETSIRTAQDLSIYSGLPPLVRTGDHYDAVFTLRNGSAKAMTVTATPEIGGGTIRANPLTVTIPAGKAGEVRWGLDAPATPGTLSWTIKARSADGKAFDTLTASQEVAPAVPVETWAASLWRVGSGAPSIMVPQGALPGGYVQVALTDTLGAPLDGVRDFMRAYPYDCFEQRLSRIVATGDNAAWPALAGSLPAYLDRDGLLRYWPVSDMAGSPELTAYALAVSSAAGLPLPDEGKGKMIAALRGVVEGRLSRDRAISADERLLRLSALAALARAGAADAGLVARIDMAAADMPTGALADWIVTLDKVPSAARSAQLRAAAEGELRKRLVYEGTRLDLADQARAPWWMMSSADEMAIKALDAVLGKPGWAADAPKLMVGVSARQQRGHWDTTPANAWGALVTRRFAGLFPASAVAGTTQASLGGKSLSFPWPRKADASPLRLPLMAGPMSLTQSGGAGPWAVVSVHAAVPLSQPLMAGYRLAREVKVVSARTPGRFSQGDVVRVRLTVEASAERNWVVINDPLPPGATVMSGLGGQSALLKQGEAGEGASPAYVEARKDSWHAFFDWLPRGRTVIEYTVRLNGTGRFTLPPSRVEAMYAPAIRAQVPNAPVTVWSR